MDLPGHYLMAKFFNNGSCFSEEYFQKDFSVQRFDRAVHLNGQYWLQQVNQITEGSIMALLITVVMTQENKNNYSKLCFCINIFIQSRAFGSGKLLKAQNSMFIVCLIFMNEIN